jgi:hypothetical protein
MHWSSEHRQEQPDAQIERRRTKEPTVTTSEGLAGLEVPPRTIPVPAHLGETAQALLAMGPLGDGSFPALDDHEGWRSMTKERDALVGSMMEARVAAFEGTVEAIESKGTTIFVITPRTQRPTIRGSISSSTVAA